MQEHLPFLLLDDQASSLLQKLLLRPPKKLAPSSMQSQHRLLQKANEKSLKHGSAPGFPPQKKAKSATSLSISDADAMSRTKTAAAAAGLLLLLAAAPVSEAKPDGAPTCAVTAPGHTTEDGEKIP